MCEHGEGVGAGGEIEQGSARAVVGLVGGEWMSGVVDVCDGLGRHTWSQAHLLPGGYHTV